MGSSRDLIDELRRDRDRLRELAMEMLKDPEVQLFLAKLLLANVATKDDVKALATKKELKGIRARMVTKEELSSVVDRLSKIEQTISSLATRDDVRRVRLAIRSMVTGEELRGLVDRLRTEVEQYVDRRLRTMEWIVALGLILLALVVALTRVF